VQGALPALMPSKLVNRAAKEIWGNVVQEALALISRCDTDHTRTPTTHTVTLKGMSNRVR